MNLDYLEESLKEVLDKADFQIITNKSGEIVIHTGLFLDDDGELNPLEDDVGEDFFENDWEEDRLDDI